MTAQLDQCAGTLLSLIRSCNDSGNGFQIAAETVEDETLKRLFSIYAQQRCRFADELKSVAPFEFAGSERTAQPARVCAMPESTTDLLLKCLQSDEEVLALYRKALVDRTLPTRAHFLISAQCSLVERVHDRMKGILNAMNRPAGPSVLVREEAVV